MPEPLVLLHGYTATPAAWGPLLPHLGNERAVHNLGLAGHTGCAPLGEGIKPSVEALVDAAEADLDRLGLQRPHLVGNSLGGWVSLLLADRGRAASVVALAPGGFWEAGSKDEQRVAGIFHRAARFGKLVRPVLPKLMARPKLRRALLREVMQHGERIPPAAAVASMEALLDCPAYPGLIEDVQARGLVVPRLELDVPVLVLQGEHDRFFPPRTFDAAIRDRLPGAEIGILHGAGHVPMADAPEEIARRVLQWAAAAEAAPAAAAGSPSGG